MKGLGLFCMAALLPLGACSSVSAPDAPSTKLTLAIAPLTLTSLGNVCYDVRVTNAPDGTGEVVWERGEPGLNGGTPDLDAMCSNQFGNGAGGDISYVGPCDADGQEDPGDLGGERTNSVTIWFDALYDTGGNYLDPDAPEGWINPCVNAAGDEVGCTLNVLCEENADAPVNFNFTIMRSALQGFFDVAVNFDNIFCSAKLDTCYSTGTVDETPITLLFGSRETRDWTAVFGFACTAGDGDAGTTLLYSQINVTCDDGSNTVVFPINPTVEEGNASVDVAGDVLHFGVYRGFEALTCATGSCNKAYWNLAFSLDDLEDIGGDCTLSLSATATDGTVFTAGLPTAVGGAYPYVELDAPLTEDAAAFCQSNPLGGDVVTTTYHGPTDPLTDPETMCYQFDADAVGPVVGAICDEPEAAPIRIIFTERFGATPIAGATFNVADGAGIDDLAVTDSAGVATFAGPYSPQTFDLRELGNSCPDGTPDYQFDGGPTVGGPYNFEYVGGTLTILVNRACNVK